MRIARVILLIIFSVGSIDCAGRMFQTVPALTGGQMEADSFEMAGLQYDYIVDARPEDVFALFQETNSYIDFMPPAHFSVEPGDSFTLSKPGDMFHMNWFKRYPGQVIASKIVQDKEIQLFIVADMWMRLHLFISPEGSSTRLRIRFVMERAHDRGITFITKLQTYYVLWRSDQIAELCGKKLHASIRRDKDSKKLFTVICKVHRASLDSRSSSEALWSNINREGVLNNALEPFVYLRPDKSTFYRQGDTAAIEAKDAISPVDISAVLVRVIPPEAAYLCVFIDEINGGAIFMTRPSQEGAEAEFVFFYEIPSDYLMSSEQMLLLSDVDSRLGVLLDRLDDVMP